MKLAATIGVMSSLLIFGACEIPDERTPPPREAPPAERPPAEPTPPAERPPAEPAEPMHDDQQIEQEIQQQIQQDEMLSPQAQQVQVRVQDGVVTRQGQVESQEESQRLEELARQAQGVQDVNNQLEVAMPNQEPY